MTYLFSRIKTGEAASLSIEMTSPVFVIHLAELQYPGGAGLDACAAADALWVVHRKALIGKVHDVYPLVAYRGADVTGNTLFLVRDNPEAAEAGEYMHQRRQWAHEPAPHPTAVPEIKPVSDNTCKQQGLHGPFIVDLYTERLPVIQHICVECRSATGRFRCQAHPQLITRAIRIINAITSITCPTMLTLFQTAPWGILCLSVSPSVSAIAPHEHIHPQ